MIDSRNFELVVDQSDQPRVLQFEGLKIKQDQHNSGKASGENTQPTFDRLTLPQKVSLKHQRPSDSLSCFSE